MSGNLKGIQAARAARAAAKAAGVAVERLDPIEKARRNPRSMRLAINGKCWDCVGADADPGPRERIRNCTSGATCPLWPLRPYQESSAEVDDSDADGIPASGSEPSSALESDDMSPDVLGCHPDQLGSSAGAREGAAP